MRAFNRTVMVCLVMGSFLVAPAGVAVSPQDIALAQKVMREAAKIADKYREYDLEAPEPLPDSSGKYVSPYTADGEVTAWAEKSLEAEAGAQAGDMAGNAAGNAVAKKVPFGSLFKGKTKDVASSAGAATAIGGWEFIRETSDVSFGKMQDIAVYLHVTHRDDPGFDESLAATMNLYPDLKKGYKKSLNKAYKDAKKAAR